MLKFAKTTIVILISAVCAVLLVEGALRAGSALFAPRTTVLDPLLGWRHAAGRERAHTNALGESVLVRQNSHGHRGPEPAAGNPASARRLLVLGDAFVEAEQVAEEDTFTSLLAAAVPNLEVLNAGVAGWSTVQEYVYLAEEGVALDPEAVLVMLSDDALVDNCLPYSPGFGPRPHAFVDQLSNTFRLETRLDPEAFRRFVLPVPFWYELHQHSRLYNLLSSRVYQPLARERLAAFAQDDREQLRRFCGTETVAVAALERMRQLLDERTIELTVAVIPVASQLQSAGAGAAAAVLAFCESRALRCVSLSPALRAAVADGAKPYLDGAPGWTAEGHRIAARELTSLFGGPARAAAAE